MILVFTVIFEPLFGRANKRGQYEQYKHEQDRYVDIEDSF